MTQFLRKFNAQHPRNDQEPDAMQQTSSQVLTIAPGDASTADYETNSNEIQVSRITVDRRDILRASITTGSGQAVHVQPATRGDLAKLPRCGNHKPLCRSS